MHKLVEQEKSGTTPIHPPLTVVRKETVKMSKKELPTLDKEQIDWAQKKVTELHPLYMTPLTELYPILHTCISDPNDARLESVESDDEK